MGIDINAVNRDVLVTVPTASATSRGCFAMEIATINYPKRRFMRFVSVLCMFLFLLAPVFTMLGSAEREWIDEIRVSSGSATKGFSDTEVNSLGETVTVWMESEGDSVQIRGTVVTSDNRYLIFGRSIVATKGNSYFPDIAIDSENHVHLVWLEWVEHQQILMYLKLDRFLTKLDSQKVLSLNPSGPHPPTLGNAPKIVYDSVESLHLTWAEERHDQDPANPGHPPEDTTTPYNDVFYLRLDLNGEFLTQVTSITDSAGDSIFPDIAASPGDVNETVLTWSNNATGNYEIFFAMVNAGELDVSVVTRQLSFSSSNLALAPSVDFRQDGTFFIAWSEKKEDEEKNDPEYGRFQLKLAKISSSGKIKQISTITNTSPGQESSDDGHEEEDKLFPEIKVNHEDEIYLFWNSNRESRSNQLTEFILSSLLSNITTLNYYFELVSFGHDFFTQPWPGDANTTDSWRSFVDYIIPILEMGTEFEEWDGYYLVLDSEMKVIEREQKISDQAGKSFFPSISLCSEDGLHMSFQNGDDDQIYFNRMENKKQAEDSVAFQGEEVFPVLAGVACVGLIGYVVLNRGRDFFWVRGKYFSLFAPLYSTISRSNAMNNKKRQEICELLAQRKGLTFSELMRMLGMKNGVLAYHLSLLEKNKYVKSARDGKYRRFFLYEDPMPFYNSIETKIVDMVKKHPRISHDQLASSIHVSKLKLNKKIEKLVHEGILIPKYGNSSVYYYSR